LTLKYGGGKLVVLLMQAYVCV